ncbi:MAG: hypothetical protein WCN92_05165 [Eubacteriales bacterium]
MKELQDFGLMVGLSSEPVPVYDYKAMTAYCKENGIEMKDLADETRESFLIDRIPYKYKSLIREKNQHN